VCTTHTQHLLQKQKPALSLSLAFSSPLLSTRKNTHIPTLTHSLSQPATRSFSQLAISPAPLLMRKQTSASPKLHFSIHCFLFCPLRAVKKQLPGEALLEGKNRAIFFFETLFSPYFCSTRKPLCLFIFSSSALALQNLLSTNNLAFQDIINNVDILHSSRKADGLNLKE
jgi:hypothetical protein